MSVIYLSFTTCCPVLVFRSTPPSRPNKAGLRVCPSVLSTKSFSDFKEDWYVGRG